MARQGRQVESLPFLLGGARAIQQKAADSRSETPAKQKQKQNMKTRVSRTIWTNLEGEWYLVPWPCLPWPIGHMGSLFQLQFEYSIVVQFQERPADVGKPTEEG